LFAPLFSSWRARRSFVILPEAVTRGEARSCGAQERSVASAFHVIHISFSDELITPNERARLDTDLCRAVHVMRMEPSRKRLGWRSRPDDGGRLSRFLPLTRAAEVLIRFSWSRPAQSTPGRVFPVSVPSIVQCPQPAGNRAARFFAWFWKLPRHCRRRSAVVPKRLTPLSFHHLQTAVVAGEFARWPKHDNDRGNTG